MSLIKFTHRWSILPIYVKSLDNPKVEEQEMILYFNMPEKEWRLFLLEEIRSFSNLEASMKFVIALDDGHQDHNGTQYRMVTLKAKDIFDFFKKGHQITTNESSFLKGVLSAQFPETPIINIMDTSIFNKKNS